MRRSNQIPTNSKQDREYLRFFTPLAQFTKPWMWSKLVSEEEHRRARRDLLAFLATAQALLPKAKIYRHFQPLDVQRYGDDFVRRMIAVETQLAQERWDLACHELYDVIYFHCIQDRRILFTIIRLLEKYL
ncbi:MAG TPA: hypothetical protein IAC31_02325 [Candidatus Faecousia intestinigallinarum]|nr:hypothetical protein [Candidatus Faecousia intestinigallinarum]